MLRSGAIEAYQRQGEKSEHYPRGRAPSVTGEDGRAAVAVALAAYQSAPRGGQIQVGEALMPGELALLADEGSPGSLPHCSRVPDAHLGRKRSGSCWKRCVPGCLSRNGGTMVKRF